jgi:Uma2 family endonuclease
VTLLKRRDDFYAQANPGPEDVLFLIEVSDSTLEYDRQIKVPLYARAGVPEVWIVNINEERVETFAEVSGGAYRTAASLARGEEIQSHSLADLRIGVSEIFG